MHPTLRPLTIFEAEDPTLDPMAIRHALPPRDHLTPMLLTGLLLATLATLPILWPDLLTAHLSIDRPDDVRLIREARRVDVVLAQIQPKAPASNPKPTEPGGSPVGGGGGAQGLGTFDPALPLPEDFKPIELQTLSREVLIPRAVLQTSGLPVQAGGDGRSVGWGPGSGGGVGGGSGRGTGAGVGPGGGVPAVQTSSALRPTLEVQPTYWLTPRDPVTNAVVTVEITIQPDGRVSHARAIDGPAFLHRNAIEAAVKWRFEPPARLGVHVPQITHIRFHYTLRKG